MGLLIRASNLQAEQKDQRLGKRDLLGILITPKRQETEITLSFPRLSLTACPDPENSAVTANTHRDAIEICYVDFHACRHDGCA